MVFSGQVLRDGTRPRERLTEKPRDPCAVGDETGPGLGGVVPSPLLNVCASKGCGALPAAAQGTRALIPPGPAPPLAQPSGAVQGVPSDRPGWPWLVPVVRLPSVHTRRKPDSDGQVGARIRPASNPRPGTGRQSARPVRGAHRSQRFAGAGASGVMWREQSPRGADGRGEQGLLGPVR